MGPNDVPRSPSASPRHIQAVVEMTDTVSLPYTTGLQRVARELMSRLDPSGAEADDTFDGTFGRGGITYRPAVWSPAAKWYRDLTEGELHALANPQERLPASTAIARRFPAPVASAVRKVLAVPAMRDLRERARQAAHLRAERPLVHLALGAPDASTVLLDLEAVWNDPIPRDELLPSLHRRGAHSAALVADVLPMLHPEWFDSVLVRDFDRFITGHLRHSELFLCISERTRLDLLGVARAKGIDRDLDARVIPLGSDIVQRSEVVQGSGSGPDAGPTRIHRDKDLHPSITDYLLMVATIEPRKNQALALDVYDQLADRHRELGLVLVGKRGWKVDELIERIERHPRFGGRLLWLEEVDDVRLGNLYRHAFLSLTPAHYEGLGMTVTEAMQFGTPVIASTGGALPEAGGDAAEYAGADDVGEWVRLIERHLDDPAHHDAAVSRARAHRPHTWDESAAAVHDAMADVFATGSGSAAHG